MVKTCINGINCKANACAFQHNCHYAILCTNDNCILIHPEERKQLRINAKNAKAVKATTNIKAEKATTNIKAENVNAYKTDKENTVCRYGSSCTKKSECKFKHLPFLNVIKADKANTNCRYGSSCTKKNDCKFKHPDNKP
jgi:hypothetical protein